MASRRETRRGKAGPHGFPSSNLRLRVTPRPRFPKTMFFAAAALVALPAAGFLLGRTGVRVAPAFQRAAPLKPFDRSDYYEPAHPRLHPPVCSLVLDLSCVGDCLDSHNRRDNMGARSARCACHVWDPDSACRLFVVTARQSGASAASLRGLTSRSPRAHGRVAVARTAPDRQYVERFAATNINLALYAARQGYDFYISIVEPEELLPDHPIHMSKAVTVMRLLDLGAHVGHDSSGQTPAAAMAPTSLEGPDFVLHTDFDTWVATDAPIEGFLDAAAGSALLLQGEDNLCDSIFGVRRSGRGRAFLDQWFFAGGALPSLAHPFDQLSFKHLVARHVFRTLGIEPVSEENAMNGGETKVHLSEQGEEQPVKASPPGHDTADDSSIPATTRRVGSFEHVSGLCKRCGRGVALPYSLQREYSDHFDAAAGARRGAGLPRDPAEPIAAAAPFVHFVTQDQQPVLNSCMNLWTGCVPQEAPSLFVHSGHFAFEDLAPHIPIYVEEQAQFAEYLTRRLRAMQKA